MINLPVIRTNFIPLQFPDKLTSKTFNNLENTAKLSQKFFSGTTFLYSVKSALSGSCPCLDYSLLGALSLRNKCY